MRKKTKISLVAAGLICLGALPTLLGFTRAFYDRSKIAPGMSADEVFRTADQWNFSITSYHDPKTQEFVTFNVVKEPGGQVYRVPKYDKTFRSKAEFLDFVDQQMSNGQAWNTQLTYLAGPIRNTYRVNFDASGKVLNVSSMVGGP